MKINSFVFNNLKKRNEKNRKLKITKIIKDKKPNNIRFDIFYPSNKNFKNNIFDLYFPTDSNDFLLVDIHGKYFSIGDKKDNIEENISLCEKGFTIASFNFSPYVPEGFDNSIWDVLKGIAYLFENKEELGLNFKKIGLICSDSSVFLGFGLLLSLMKSNKFSYISAELKGKIEISKVFLRNPVFDFNDYCDYFKKFLTIPLYKQIFKEDNYSNEFIKTNSFGKIISQTKFNQSFYLCYEDKNNFHQFIENLKFALLNSNNFIIVNNDQIHVDVVKEIEKYFLN